MSDINRSVLTFYTLRGGGYYGVCEMARKLRIEYPGALYHVMNRGDRREPIFKDDQDRELFLETLGQACTKTGWQVHAYSLMPNHFHLIVETMFCPRACDRNFLGVTPQINLNW